MHSCYLRIESDKRRHIITKHERYYQKILEIYLGGVQKRCALGIADIVNDHMVVEIKDWKNYRVAMGQMMVYAHYFTDRACMIIYFGDQPSNSDEIKAICLEHNILAIDISEL